MAKSEARQWITAFVVSIAAHAVVLTALASTLASRPSDMPDVTLPTGESSTLTVYLMTAAEVVEVFEPGFVEDVESAIEEPVVPEVDPIEPSVPSTVLASLSRLGEVHARSLRWLESEAAQLSTVRNVIAETAHQLEREPEPTPLREPEPAPVVVEAKPAPPLATEPHASTNQSPGVIERPVASSTNRPPVYPEACRKRGQAGTTLLHFNIAADGSVTSVQVKSSSGYEALDKAALAAARLWRFAPATQDGVAIPCEVDLPIDFILKRR